MQIVAHEETRKALARANDPNRPVPTRAFDTQDADHPLVIGNQTLQLRYPGANHDKGNIGTESMMAQQDWTVLVLHDHCLAGSMQHLEAFLDRLIAQRCEFTLDFPPECVLIAHGRPMPALESAFQAASWAR